MVSHSSSVVPRGGSNHIGKWFAVDNNALLISLHIMNCQGEKTEWKYSCGDSTMEERQPIIIHGVRGVLAGRLAGHKTMPASSLIRGAPPLT